MTSTAASANSTAQSTPATAPSQPPANWAEEIAGRVADQSPLWPIAHAAGLQHLREIWADSAIKRRMDRAAQAKALGVEEAVAGNQEMPGDISVKRDEVHHHYPAAQPSTPSVPTIGSSTGSKIWPLVLGASLALGSGGLGALAMQWLHKPQPTPQATLPDYQLRLEVKDKP